MVLVSFTYFIIVIMLFIGNLLYTIVSLLRRTEYREFCVVEDEADVTWIPDSSNRVTIQLRTNLL